MDYDNFLNTTFCRSWHSIHLIEKSSYAINMLFVTDVFCQTILQFFLCSAMLNLAANCRQYNACKKYKVIFWAIQKLNYIMKIQYNYHTFYLYKALCLSVRWNFFQTSCLMLFRAEQVCSWAGWMHKMRWTHKMRWMHNHVAFQARLVLSTLHGDLDNHVHTLVAVQAYQVLLTLHGNLANHVHTLVAVQA